MVDVGYMGKMGNMSLDDRGDTEITEKLVHYGHIYTQGKYKGAKSTKFILDHNFLSVLRIIGQRL